MEVPFLNTADLARATGTTPRRVRHYRDLGILKPAYTGGREMYDATEQKLFRLAIKAADLGFSLDVIRSSITEDRTDIAIPADTARETLKQQVDTQIIVKKQIIQLRALIRVTATTRPLSLSSEGLT